MDESFFVLIYGWLKDLMVRKHCSLFPEFVRHSIRRLKAHGTL